MEPSSGNWNCFQQSKIMVPIRVILGLYEIMVPIRVILGLYWGYMGDNGKENGNYYNGLFGWLSKL